MRFEWDERKNQVNMRKHGVDFRDAVTVFCDPLALSIPDDEHSENEERWVLLGRAPSQTLLVVIHTIRHEEVMRIISARKATLSERNTYEMRARK
jgi:uncharacterized DUF497 family protein